MKGNLVPKESASLFFLSTKSYILLFEESEQHYQAPQLRNDAPKYLVDSILKSRAGGKKPATGITIISHS